MPDAPQPFVHFLPDAPKRAREQATAYGSVFSPTPLELDYADGGSETIEIPPHPNLSMLDDERQAAYEELMFEVEGYDRDPDIYIPEQNLDNGVVLPAETKKGRVLQPYRKDGVLVKPPHSVRVVQVCLGEELYGKLRRAGLQAADVWRIWNEQGLELAARADADPKSNGSPRPVGRVRR
jgi:hypothetical protein